MANQPTEDGQHSYCIQGIPVVFPYKAYPSQLAVMDKILKGLTRKQNCLIESPTGTGKSLALLCSCLAWQQHKKNENIEDMDISVNEKIPDLNISEISSSADAPISNTVNPEEQSNLSTYAFDDAEDDDFKLPKKLKQAQKLLNPNQSCVVLKAKSSMGMQNYFMEIPPSEMPEFLAEHPKEVSFLNRIPVSNDFVTVLPLSSKQLTKHTAGTQINSPVTAVMKFRNGIIHRYPATPVKIAHVVKLTNTPIVSMAVNNEKLASTPLTSATNIVENYPQPATSFPRIPQIYYGTRTHKQITQIIQELQKSVYRNTKMCILSSRDRTCIHEEVSKGPDKNNKCKELLDKYGGPACFYYRRSQKVGFDELRKFGLHDCWDLEDLVKVGKRLKACPYYTIRNLMDADIIFCPYNYLIDPLIRCNMKIDLKNSILIFDEAHNIEDSARSAASFTVTEDDIQRALQDVEKLGFAGYKTYSLEVVASVLAGLNSWIHRNKDNLVDYSEFNQSGKVWTGEELVAMLTEIKAGPDDFNYITKHFKNVTEEKTEENYDKPTLTGATVALITGLLMIFKYLYYKDMVFMQDYRAVITKTSSNRQQISEDGFVRRNTRGWTYALNFWCLNPAVAMSSFKDMIDSLIVASGTLSPMTTFQSELDVDFPIILEANHVISKQQVWIGSIGCGPNNTMLKAVHREVDRFAFQDELGQLILKVCQIVPHGVLCFFSSYSMLEKLIQRWQMTNVWEELESCKIISCEPRSTDRKNFELSMQEFYETILDDRLNGALYFAVFRGKVSEGLNFADNNARAVISVGIPFPNIKDIQVDLKKKYNDKFCNERQLMPGGIWYETQGFRALNQALGRCIRHKNDWGALILVDDRFKEQRNVAGLSKWVRNGIVHYHQFSQAISSLNKFITNGQLMKSYKLQIQGSINRSPSSSPLFE